MGQTMPDITRFVVSAHMFTRLQDNSRATGRQCG
jgi:hypothetical protein